MKEKSDLFLGNKKIGFLMKEKSDLFLGTERIGFLMNEKSDLFCDIYIKKKSNLYIKKNQICFYICKKY